MMKLVTASWSSSRFIPFATSIAGFYLIPLVSGAATVFAISFIIKSGGAEGWASIAIAQALGSVVASIGSFGYGIVGPTEVAKTNVSDQPKLYWVSVLFRGMILLAISPVALISIFVLISPSQQLVAIIVFAGVSLQAMSPSWFLTGQNRPYFLALFETIPRASVLLFAIAMLAITENLLIYGSIILGGEIAIAGFAFLKLGHRPATGEPLIPLFKNVLQHQYHVAISSILSSGYSRGAVLVVATVSPGSVPLFAAADKVQILARASVRPLSMFFQGWVVRKGHVPYPRRAFAASLVTILGGTIVGVMVAIFLPLWGHLLFANEISVNYVQSMFVGITIAILTCSSALGLYFLIPMRSLQVFMWASTAAVVFGFPLLLVSSLLGGVTGSLAAVMITELCLMVGQSLFIALKWNKQIIDFKPELSIPNK